MDRWLARDPRYAINGAVPIQPQSIRSSSNGAFRRAREVSRGKSEGQILLEGARLVGDALKAGFALEAVWVREDRLNELDGLELGSVPCYAAPAALYDRLGSVKSPPPLLALAGAPKAVDLRDLDHGGEPLALVVAGVQDPGNLGALARSAEAAGARFLVHIDLGARPFSPKALRGSMGSLLRLPVVTIATADGARQELEALGYRNLCAKTRGGQEMNRANWSGKIALWVSGETGAEPEAMDSMEGVTIHLAGEVESLNAAVAASILLFAAGRVKAPGGA